MGIKILGEVEIYESAENIMRISAKAALRDKFAASVMDIMEQLQLDGMYFNWQWPGCPRVYREQTKYKSLCLICFK